MDGEQIVHDVAERVRALVSEAEERAAALVHEAEEEARRIRESAEAEARERLAAVRSALDDLQGSLRAGGAPDAEITPGPVTVPEPAPPDIPEPTPDPVPEPVPGPQPVPEPGPEPVPEPAPPDEPEAANGAPAGGPSSDKAAARLVAMKMALDGASREEIDAHLESTYDVEDREKLLDDVLARAKA
jgi:outer membrane biosynthesis protein TonB